jgi:hypothetical protein
MHIAELKDKAQVLFTGCKSEGTIILIIILVRSGTRDSTKALPKAIFIFDWDSKTI